MGIWLSVLTNNYTNGLRFFFSDYFVNEQNSKRSRGKKRILEVFKLLIGTSTGCGWKIEENKKTVLIWQRQPVLIKFIKKLSLWLFSRTNVSDSRRTHLYHVHSHTHTLTHFTRTKQKLCDVKQNQKEWEGGNISERFRDFRRKRRVRVQCDWIED